MCFNVIFYSDLCEHCITLSQKSQYLSFIFCEDITIFKYQDFVIITIQFLTFFYNKFIINIYNLTV